MVDAQGKFMVEAEKFGAAARAFEKVLRQLETAARKVSTEKETNAYSDAVARDLLAVLPDWRAKLQAAREFAEDARLTVYTAGDGFLDEQLCAEGEA